MINVPASGYGNSKLYRESALLYDQNIKNLLLEVAWLNPAGLADASGNANRTTSTRYALLHAVEERTSHNDLLPALSVLTTVNVVRAEFVCMSQDDVNHIVELINRDQVVTNFRNEISNEGDDDTDDNEDD